MTLRLVTTPTGNTGRHVLATVAASDPAVRVLVRDPAKLTGATPGEVLTGDLRDPPALARALAGVDSAFFCVPQSENPDDVVAYFNSFARPFADASAAAGVKRLVVISGGEEGQGDGPGEALQSNERILAQCGAAARFVRCGYFMENLLWQAQPLAHAGVFTLPLPPDVPLALVAAADIGNACGRLLLDDGWSATRAVEACGPRKVTLAEAAAVMSAALGKPVRYVKADPDAWADQLTGYGLSRAMAVSLKEMFAAIEKGCDMGREPDAPLDCPTTFEVWTRETLAPAVRDAGGV